MNIVPTVGRMVYYMARGSADGKFPKKERAAVITDVMEFQDPVQDFKSEWKVRVCVLNPEGMFFSDWLTQGAEGGQWDWMPYTKEQAAKTE